MSEIELKRCPFCGCEANLVPFTDDTWEVQCSNKWCRCHTAAELSKVQAAFRWNKRQESTKVVARVEVDEEKLRAAVDDGIKRAVGVDSAALSGCREMKEILPVATDMARENERLEKENAELKGEVELLQCVPFGDGYMKLPVDAQGIEIRPGDKIYFNGDPESTPLKCIAIGCPPAPVEWADWEETGTTACGEGRAFTHLPPNIEPPDSWEKLEEDAGKSTCGYAGQENSPDCGECKWGSFSVDCEKSIRLEIAKRAKKLAGIGEEAE